MATIGAMKNIARSTFEGAKRMPLTQEFTHASDPGKRLKRRADRILEYDSGRNLAQFQETLDRQVEPLGLAAMDVLWPGGGEHIIDIGCGCGQTSLALAARVRPTGSVVGVDLRDTISMCCTAKMFMTVS